MPNTFPSIVYEDAYLLAVNKPAGWLSEPDRFGHRNAVDWVRSYLAEKQKKVYVENAHRLDRPTSGLLLLAKKPSILKQLNQQSAERTVEKWYQALTTAAPPQREGLLEHFLLKSQAEQRAFIYNAPQPGAVKVTLRYQIEPKGEHFLWNIELLTGKYHQIRAQLAHLGCPIIGDEKYGSTTAYQLDSIALCACKLVLTHPFTGERLKLEVDCPFLNNELTN